MRKTVIWLFTLVLLLLCSPFAMAEQSGAAGAGENGFKLYLGYNGAQAHYQNIYKSMFPSSTHNAWLNGLTTELRYDGPISIPLFARINFDYMTGGSIQNTMYKTELDLGYKVWNPGNFSLAPYVGAGYLDWDMDASPNSKSSLTSWYGTIGAEGKYRATKDLLVGLDASILWPFSPELKYRDLQPLPIPGGFSLNTINYDYKSQIGWQVRIPVLYDAYKTSNLKLFTFLTPYWEHWSFGQPPPYRTVLGVTHVNFYVSERKVDLYGFKVGIGLNF